MNSLLACLYLFIRKFNSEFLMILCVWVWEAASTTHFHVFSCMWISVWTSDYQWWYTHWIESNHPDQNLPRMAEYLLSPILSWKARNRSVQVHEWIRPQWCWQKKNTKIAIHWSGDDYFCASSKKGRISIYKFEMQFVDTTFCFLSVVRLFSSPIPHS